MKLRNRARYRDQRQERENPGFDSQRPQGHLLGTQKTAERDHAAIEDREEEERARNRSGRCFSHGAWLACNFVGATRRSYSQLIVTPNLFRRAFLRIKLWLRLWDEC